MGSQSWRRVGALVFVGIAWAGTAHPATFTVGGDMACSHANLTSAIAASEANAGADVIRVARNQAYTQVALNFDLTQPLEIQGGFANCSQAVSDGTYTTLDGSGGAADPVLRVDMYLNGSLRLRWLRITGGDEDGSGEGGGIYAYNGPLELRDCEITQNLAGYGGGIYYVGGSPDDKLTLRSNVQVTSNTARYSGGGIYVSRADLTMVEPGSLIAFNEAQGLSDSGYGGGLMFFMPLAQDEGARHASIGTGFGNFGAIYSNSARYGGGIAIFVRDDSNLDALLQMFQAHSDLPAAIRGNVASVAGGGLYLRSNRDRLPELTTGYAQAELWNVQVIDNAAPQGAAAWLESDEDPVFDEWVGSRLFFNQPNLPVEALPCPVDSYCGGVMGNRTEDTLGNPTDGAIIDVRKGSYVHFSASGTGGSVHGGVLVSNNVGGMLIKTSGYQTVPSYNAVFVGNQVQHELFRILDGTLRLSQSTIADNTIGADWVFGIGHADGLLELTDSLAWQPGKSVVFRQFGTLSVNNVFANEVASLGGPPAAYTMGSPRFIDPLHEDYRLRAASEAIDRGPATAAADRDAFRRIRDVRIPVVPRPDGQVRDVGAFERPELQPLVLNSDFPADLRLWKEVAPGSTSWVSNENGFGENGALKVEIASGANQQVTAASQCVHLPGPELWALNASGKSGPGPIGSRDLVFLRWELRHNGGEACNAGPADLTGTHNLTTSNSWTRPASPALIEQLAENWTVNSSLTIQLVVKENGVSAPTTAVGWFDGITLLQADPPPPPALIFKDGFEQF